MTDSKIELYTLLEKDATKIYVRNLSLYTEDMKNAIKILEDKLCSKSCKRKIDNQLECGFICENSEIFKEFLIKELNIEEKNIKIVNQEENKDDTKKKDKELLNKINKKITMQFVKEGNKKKTFLTNISVFLEKQNMQNFCKKLQKILGSSSILNSDGDCGFSGDYTTDTSKREIIKKFILDNTEITKEYIDF